MDFDHLSRNHKNLNDQIVSTTNTKLFTTVGTTYPSLKYKETAILIISLDVYTMNLVVGVQCWSQVEDVVHTEM